MQLKERQMCIIFLSSFRSHKLKVCWNIIIFLHNNTFEIVWIVMDIKWKNNVFDLWSKLPAYCISSDIVDGCIENDVKLQEINKLIIDLILAPCTCWPWPWLSGFVFPQNSAIESQSLVRKFNISGLIDLMEF